MVWDPESWWALQSPSLPSPDLDYLAAVRQVHRVLWRQGRTVAFVSPHSPMPDLPLLVVPLLYLTSAATARFLADYAEQGGILVVTYGSGTADEHARVWPGGYPGALRDLLGVRALQHYPLDPAVDAVTVCGEDGEYWGRARRWSEELDVADAKVVARYADGPFAGRAAVTRVGRGAGQAWYVSCDLEDAGLAEGPVPRRPVRGHRYSPRGGSGTPGFPGRAVGVRAQPRQRPGDRRRPGAGCGEPRGALRGFWSGAGRPRGRSGGAAGAASAVTRRGRPRPTRLSRMALGG